MVNNKGILYDLLLYPLNIFKSRKPYSSLGNKLEEIVSKFALYVDKIDRYGDIDLTPAS